MVIAPRATLALIALTGAAVLASVQPASAACRVSVEFRNPYLSQVQVDLKESKVQIRLGPPLNAWGAKRKLGTGTLRVHPVSTRNRSFNLPLGTCRSRRQYTWVMTYRGEQYDRVLREREVRFADFAGMPTQPRVRTPSLTKSPPRRGTGNAVVPDPLFAWTVARSRNGTFPWVLWSLDDGARTKVADGTTRRKRLRIPPQPNGLYQLDLRQQDGAGYQSARVQPSASVGNETPGYQFTIRALRTRPRN